MVSYRNKKENIKKRLNNFKDLNEKEQFKEMLFCLLTPQSNAKKCWIAVKEISALKEWNKKEIINILRTKTRFHNNKTTYILQAKKTWRFIKKKLDMENKKELRNFIAKSVKGYGLKEASHFLRNIGRSNNEIAILDRHILRNLKESGMIETEKIMGRKDYLEIEQKFLDFSTNIGIPIDELDLLFWSKENGEIFK